MARIYKNISEDRYKFVGIRDKSKEPKYSDTLTAMLDFEKRLTRTEIAVYILIVLALYQSYPSLLTLLTHIL